MDTKVSLGMFGQTLPYVIARAAVYMALAMGVLAYAGIAGWIAHLGRHLGDADGTFRFAVFGLAAGGLLPLARLVEMQLLEPLRAGHLALVSRIIVECDLPAGASQYELAQETLATRMGEGPARAAVARAVDEALVALAEQATPVADVPAAARIPAVALRPLRAASLQLVRDAILVHAMMRGGPSARGRAAEGIVLYAQGWEPVLDAAVRLTLGGWSAAAVTALGLAVPCWPLAALVGSGGPLALVLRVLPLAVAIALKHALYDGFAMTAAVDVFERTVHGQHRSADWDAHLAHLSPAFRELVGSAPVVDETLAAHALGVARAAG